MDAFMGEAVAARPIRSVRAGVAFGVVDTFLVRAADDAVGCTCEKSDLVAIN